MNSKLKQSIVSIKDQLVIFNSLTDSELDRILDHFNTEKYSGGSFLFKEGDPSGFIAFILSGKLEVHKQTEFKDKQIVLARLNKGSFIGESALINETEQRKASVVVLEDSEIMTLKNADLETITREHPPIGVKIMRGLLQITAMRLVKAVEKVAMAY